MRHGFKLRPLSNSKFAAGLRAKVGDFNSSVKGSLHSSSILGKKSLVPLVFFFLVSFLTPVAVGYLVYSKIAEQNATAMSRINFFPKSIVIEGDRDFIRIAHQDDLNPLPGKDFLFFAWFQLRRLPLEGNRLILVSKYSPETKNEPGYRIAIEKAGGTPRIAVYWRDSSGKGRWFTFGELPLLPREWFMLGVSLHNQRYLGVHTISLASTGKADVRLIGGYDLGEESVIPDSAADLVLGSVRSGGFRGRLGAIGIIQGKELARDFKPLLKELGKSPQSKPSSVSSRMIRLWTTDFSSDNSEFKHEFAREGGRGSAKKP